RARLRLSLRAFPPSGNATRRAGAHRAGHEDRLQHPRPAHESRRRTGPGGRRLVADDRQNYLRGPRSARSEAGIRRARRGRHRRAFPGRDESRRRGGRRSGPRARARSRGRAEASALRPPGAPRRRPGRERPGDSRRLRRRRRRSPQRHPSERRRRDRGGRTCRRSARGPRARARGDRLGRGDRAARPLDRVLARDDGRSMSRFRDALAAPGLGAIAEVKRRSPSAGDLRPDADPARLAAQFANAGAVAVSILVDDQFGGSLDDLKAARAATAAPLLAKGFFTEELDLLKLKLAGADAALILLRDVDDARDASLLSYAGELGIETLVEAHDANELQRAVALEAEVIGVNARDLTTFEIDRKAQLELIARLRRHEV